MHQGALGPAALGGRQLRATQDQQLALSLDRLQPEPQGEVLLASLDRVYLQGQGVYQLLDSHLRCSRGHRAALPRQQQPVLPHLLLHKLHHQREQQRFHFLLPRGLPLRPVRRQDRGLGLRLLHRLHHLHRLQHLAF